MKRILSIIFAVLILGMSPVGGLPVARADELVSITAPVVTSANGSAQAVFTLTISPEGLKQMGSFASFFRVRYGRVGDSKMVSDWTTLPCTAEAAGVEGCAGTPGTTTYTVTIQNIRQVGLYAYDIGYYESSSAGGDNTYHSLYPKKDYVGTFSVTNIVAERPFARFVAAVVVKSSANVTVTVHDLPFKAQGYMQLGTATQKGDTSNYLCTPGSITSPVIPVTPAADGSPVQVTFPFTKLPDGYYCVRVQANIPPVGLMNVGDPNAIDGNGYFFAKSSLFAIGGKLAPGATNDPSANPTGCVTKSDNSNYCMLAPLPGLGDGTGDLDVTKGVGEYFLIIIQIVMGLIGVLSVLMITLGGIEYMTTVSVGEKEGAKSRITSALFGLLLALSSYIVLRTLNPELVNLGVTIPGVEVSTTPDEYVPTSGGGEYTGSSADSNVTKNVDAYDSLLKASAAKHGVECTFMKALMYAESGGSPNASSGKGAKGLIQLMPATFKGLGYDPSMISDPATNIDAASKYIAQLKKNGCNGAASNSVCNVNDPRYVIAAYNAGPGSNGLSTVCQKAQSKNMTAWQCTENKTGYTQTRNYVQKVLANYEKLKSTPGWGC